MKIWSSRWIGPVLGLVVIAVLLGLGFAAGRLSDRTPSATGPAASEPDRRRVLYWYDPMVPAQHFDKPGKSPFMDMQLLPRYADEAAGAEPGVQIDPVRTQNLGIRLAAARTGTLPGGLEASGTIEFNARDVAVVQARAGGFVQRVHGLAPSDIVPAGAPLADLLVPEWAGAQGEFLAVRETGDTALVQAARQRLQLLGMPLALIAEVERTGQVRNVVTIRTPIGGMIKSLAVRTGMAVAAGETLAEVNGLARVWLHAAVPEAEAGKIRLREPSSAVLAAFPGERFSGHVAAILPQTDSTSRTLTVRIELPNRDGRLRPGMFAAVTFGGVPKPALLIPTEAVIRTGRRTLVMLAQAGGRFQPAEVQIGREATGQSEVLAGLSEGEEIVSSGQFLIDSEASLSGIGARPLTDAPSAAPR